MAIVKATYSGINPPEKTRIQVSDTVLADANVSVTADQLIHFLLSMTPTVSRTITLPPAADIVALLSHATAADGLEFEVRNFGVLGVTITVVPPGALSGTAVVDGGSYKTFVIRLDTVGAAPTYTLNDLGTSGSLAAAGDVAGPSSSTDNAVAVFDGVTGKLIKETFAADPLRAVSDANDNVLIGTGTAFAALTSGVDNTILGADAAPLMTSGPRNILIGNGVAPLLTTAPDCVIIGNQAASILTTGRDNTLIGRGVTTIVFGTVNSTAVGSTARAADDGIALGAAALATGVGDICIGAFGRAGLGSTTMGYRAGSGVATDSIAIGVDALNEPAAAKTENIAIGNDALTNLTTGGNNVCMGHTAGTVLTTGSGNVLLGNAAVAAAVGTTNSIGLGSGIQGTSAPDTNEIYLDNDVAHVNTQALFVPRLNDNGAQVNLQYEAATGEITQLTSSRRYKKNIVPLRNVSDIVDALQPVEFDYKKSDQHCIGMIAEDVYECLPEIVPLNKEGEPHSINYELLSVLLLQEVQKLKTRVAALEK